MKKQVSNLSEKRQVELRKYTNEEIMYLVQDALVELCYRKEASPLSKVDKALSKHYHNIEVNSPTKAGEIKESYYALQRILRERRIIKEEYYFMKLLADGRFNPVQQLNVVNEAVKKYKKANEASNRDEYYSDDTPNLQFSRVYSKYYTESEEV